MGFIMDGQLYVCTVSTHVTPGNLRAFVQAKLRRISDGTSIERRLRSTEDVEQAFLDRREMEYLYSEKDSHIFMDAKSYDQLSVSDEVLGDSIKYLKPNTTVVALTHEGNIVSLELPKVVELAVTETTPVPRGATATNQMKDATLEGGLRVRVPPFIEVGEIVRVNTEDGSYGGRAKG
jgi:elongation factor P